MDLDAGKPDKERELWWKLDEAEAGPEAVRTFRAIEESLSDRRNQMLRQARTWSNSWIGSLYDLGAARLDRRIGPWNVCAAAVSTAQSMVCRSPVAVTIETSNAEYSLQRDSRDATRWLYGVWAENRVAPQLAPTLFNDASIVDVGVAVVRVVAKRLVIDRVFPDEVIISEAEALYGSPYQAAIKTYRPKHVVLEQYGTTAKKRKAILDTPVEAPGNGSATDYSANLIPVWECWAVNGAHLVAVPTMGLEMEAWDEDFVPLVPMYVDQPIAGWWGRGYVQQLLGYQLELFAINDAIDEHVRLTTNAKWVVEAASGIDADDLGNNEIAEIITKNKGASDPRLLSGDVPQALLEERQKIYDTALAEIGLNSWSVAAQEPAERSGVGMEVARDKERGRLVTAGSNYEDWHVRLAYVCFALGPKTAGTEYDGKGPADKALSKVDFKTVAKFLKDKPWRVRVFPKSALPEDPQGKRDTVEKWLEMGLITGPVAQSLVELPDVDAEASLVSAAREDIMWCIEEIMEKGAKGYHPPEPIQDLDLGKRMFMSWWLKARRQGVPEARLDLLQKWIREAQALQKAPPPAQVEQRQGVGLAPAAAEPVNVEGAGAAAPPGTPATGGAPGLVPDATAAPPPELAGAPPANDVGPPPAV